MLKSEITMITSSVKAYVPPAGQFPWGLGDFPVGEIRRDFPILSEKTNGRDLIWFDNAATTQKPACVIDRISRFYLHENSNIHRGAHELAERATDAYEEARKKVARFLNASSADEIVFVRSATEAINLIAGTFGRQTIGAGDEIILSQLEHHANIVPWQLLCEETGAELRVIPVDRHGQLIMDEYEKLLNQKTKLVSVTYVSNALGTITPIEEIICMAHQYGAKVLIDGAQAAPHIKVDVAALDCDFYVFSGHKVYGPTGIGAAYIRSDIGKNLPPYQGGGNMIADVTFEKTRYQNPPVRFEAGTGSIADAVGLGEALDYVEKRDLCRIGAYENSLLLHAEKGFRTIPDVTLIGTAERKASLCSFVIRGFSAEEIGQKLNEYGIAVRAGHHCAQPVLRQFGLERTVRSSFACYNTKEEIDEMIRVLKRIQKRKSNFFLHNPFFVVY